MKAGRAGTHPHHRLRHLEGFAKPAHADKTVSTFFLTSGSPNKRSAIGGLDRRGTNRVDSDSVSRDLERRRFGQPQNTMFAGGVGRGSIAANETGNRRRC